MYAEQMNSCCSIVELQTLRNDNSYENFKHYALKEIKRTLIAYWEYQDSFEPPKMFIAVTESKQTHAERFFKEYGFRSRNIPSRHKGKTLKMWTKQGYRGFPFTEKSLLKEA